MKNKLFILIIIILAFLPIITLLHPGLPMTHDGQDHVTRIANFYQNLTEGNIIPRWAPNLNWGFGHPVIEFLYPLPSYIASFFHFIGFDLVDSTKIVFGMGIVFSLSFMYLWLSQFLSKQASLFGAVLYTYAPYKFVEAYVRGDIGENLAFAFVPLVLYFVFKLYKKNELKYLLLGGISMALLILAHNAISLMLVPFIVFYGLFLAYKSKNPKIYLRNFVFLMGLGFGLSAFFWIPGLIEGKYTLRNIVTKGVYANSFASIERMIYSNWSYGGTGQLSIQLGVFQWISLIISPLILFMYKIKKNKDYLLISFLLFYTLVSIFLMLPISDFVWSRIILLQNFQFPWRFLGIIVFTTAVLGGYLAQNLPKKFSTLAIAISIILIIFVSSFYWNAKGYVQKPQSFYAGIYNSTTDTGESAPIWSVRFMEKRAKAHLEVIDGVAKIEELERRSTYHKYKVVAEKKTLFGENTLYFPGWEIRANGNILHIEFQNMTYRGIMLFQLEKGDYIIEAQYKETKLRLISDIISLLSIVIILSLLTYRFVKSRLS